MGREDPRRRIGAAELQRTLAPIIAQRRAEAAALQAAIDKAVAEDELGFVWWHHRGPEICKRKKDPPPARASGQRRV